MAEHTLAFEDLCVGDTWTSESREMTTAEIREFADLTGDFNRIHLDEEYAAETPFGEPIAHGLLGLSVLAGLSSIAPAVRTTALLSIDGWRFRKPIFVGDQIQAVTEVSELRDHGRRHGEVHWFQQLINQRGEVVQEGVLASLVERRQPTPNRPKKLQHIDAATPILAPHISEDAVSRTSKQQASS